MSPGPYSWSLLSWGMDPQQGSAHLDHINKGCTSHLDPVPGSDSLPNGVTPKPDLVPLQLSTHLALRLSKHLQLRQLILNALFSILKTSIFNN